MKNRLLAARDYDILNRVGKLLDEARLQAARAARQALLDGQAATGEGDAALLARALVHEVFKKMVDEYAPGSAHDRVVFDPAPRAGLPLESRIPFERPPEGALLR